MTLNNRLKTALTILTMKIVKVGIDAMQVSDSLDSEQSEYPDIDAIQGAISELFESCMTLIEQVNREVVKPILNGAAKPIKIDTARTTVHAFKENIPKDEDEDNIKVRPS